MPALKAVLQSWASWNMVCDLYITDTTSNELIKIKNGIDYPNLHYDEKFNKISSVRFYGGVSIHFLSILDDSLQEQFNIDCWKEDTCECYEIINNQEVLRGFALRNYDCILPTIESLTPFKISDSCN